ncbi:MAG: ABC transporter ATP-binding protein [Hyphomicrobiaceae bacterium]|nr:ABC transporter ATP-binding protein [Hyphomicrobiaceae bacterium]
MSRVIETKNLGIGYPDHPVGRGIEVAVSAGEVLCLLGPNGCGKTTLFKTMLGLLDPQEGEVWLDGAPLTSLPRNEVAKRIAYVPQAHTAHFPYRVIDMVLMGRTAHLGTFATPGSQDHERACQALEALGITDLAHAEYTRISGGQRQLSLIARALAQNTPTLVMDEPTASLDFGNQVLVLEQIMKLSGTGLSIVLSTHNPDHAFACANKVAILSDGRIAAHGSPAKVITPKRLRSIYGVDVSIEKLRDGQTVCAPTFAQ